MASPQHTHASARILKECARQTVLMTSVATILGHFPLVLATGPGAAARNSIGMMLVTGMTVGTLFTLFVVPVFYVLIAAQHQPVQTGTALNDVES